MTKIRTTYPTQAEIDAVMFEARQMRAAMIAKLCRNATARLRGALAAQPAAA